MTGSEGNHDQTSHSGACLCSTIEYMGMELLVGSFSLDHTKSHKITPNHDLSSDTCKAKRSRRTHL